MRKTSGLISELAKEWKIWELELLLQKKVDSINPDITTALKVKNLLNFDASKQDNLLPIMQDKLSFIYWDQIKSFHKLLQADRTTYILTDDSENHYWILAYKKELQHDIARVWWGIWYIEVKSLLLLDDEMKWKGLIYILIQRLIEDVRMKYPNANGIVCTVSNTHAAASQELFKKLWFVRLFSDYWIYAEGDTETTMYFPINKQLSSKKWDVPIKNPYFDMIQSWSKTTEGRAGKMYADIFEWDDIVFKNGSATLVKKVLTSTHYPTLEEYLKVEGYKECIPNARNMEDAMQAYKNIPGYADKIKRLWIYWIKI